MKKILVVLLLMSIAMLSGCVTRLPERQALAPSAIPNLNEGNARGYFYMGFQYVSFSEQRIKGHDGELFINDQKISYVSAEGAVVVDLSPGTHKIYWDMYAESQRDKDFFVPYPYELTVKAGDIVYLECNAKYVSSTGADIAGILGEAIGGALGGKATHVANYFEEEPVEGPKFLKEMTIVDYQDLSGL